MKVGDVVQPKPEWRDDANRIPHGRIKRVAAWGAPGAGALYVGDDPRAFAAYVFELAGSQQTTREAQTQD